MLRSFRIVSGSSDSSEVGQHVMSSVSNRTLSSVLGACQRTTGTAPARHSLPGFLQRLNYQHQPIHLADSHARAGGNLLRGTRVPELTAHEDLALRVEVGFHHANGPDHPCFANH